MSDRIPLDVGISKYREWKLNPIPLELTKLPANDNSENLLSPLPKINSEKESCLIPLSQILTLILLSSSKRRKENSGLKLEIKKKVRPNKVIIIINGIK